MTFLIQSREQHEYNTDPQRRCYDGCHASSEWRWTDWGTLGSAETEDEAKESVEGWRYLNRNVKNRRLEYRYIPKEVEAQP